MPVSKKRNKDRKKRRDREPSGAPAAAPAAEAPAGGGGFLSRMRGGIQTVAGAAPKKKESLLSKILTWALVAVAAWFVAKRFGILR